MTTKIVLTPDTMLSDEVLLRAGHFLYTSEYADEYNRKGGCFGAGAQLEHCVDRAPDEKLLPIMRKYEQRLSDAWGRSVKEVSELLRMDDEDGQVNVVYYTLMPCRGHGVSLNDDHRENMEYFEDATGEEFKYAPFYTDLTELNDLALELMETPIDIEYQVVEKATQEVMEGGFFTEDAAEECLNNIAYKPEMKDLYEVVYVDHGDEE